MATPNYGYEKRQKELAKKQKKAEKLKAREERKLHPNAEAPEQAGSETGAPSDASPGVDTNS